MSIRALLEARTAMLADVEQSPPERLLLLSDLTGTLQVYERREQGLIQLTALPEPVRGARYVPHRRQAIVQADEGGNERHQLYLLDLDLDLDRGGDEPVQDFGQLHALTSRPEAGHQFAGVSPDGARLAYVSDRHNGVDFDLWICDLRTGRHERVYAPGAWLHPGSGFSPDGRLVSVIRPGDRPLDEDLVLVDPDTGEACVPLPHPGEAALTGPPAWIDPHRFYAATNAGRDFRTIVLHDLRDGSTTTPLPVGERADAEVAGNQHLIAVIENRDGASAITLYHPHQNGGTQVPLDEPGVVSSYFIDLPQPSADGQRLYFTLSTPRLPGDVFVHDRSQGATRRLTHSPSELDPAELVTPTHHRIRSFDGEEIPLFVFRPPRTREAKPPVVVHIHGGPEAQALVEFDPEVQALALSGYAVIVPNVRGSTGYGKRYASLDDTTKRLDSVRDLRAIHGALDDLGFDSTRAALWGGSYGGYMVLAGLAFQPDLWAAGVDIVGVSDLVTFLQNTSDYRRAHREREYGSLAHDLAFLTEASPMTHLEAIRAPLFVIHGRNDPRVPVTEAQQLVESLAKRGIKTTLCIYEDEGHGLARLENRLDAYPRAVAFLDEALDVSPGA